MSRARGAKHPVLVYNRDRSFESQRGRLEMDDRLKLWLERYGLFLLVGVAAIAITLLAVRIHLRFWSMDTVGSDTYYAWVEGRRINDGRNPYERILHGNMEENNKYATYFPLFYEASALVQRMGLRQYQEWIDFWRYIFLLCNIATGVALCLTLFSKRTWVLALLAMLFWYFNRWTLHTSATVALDFIPILLMILSLVVHDKYRKTALLFYSISLATKQIAIFLAPLYLIWEYQETRSIKKVIIAGLWIVSIPLLTSLPFLFWNAEGFIRSIGFSATRIALNHFGAESIDSILNLNGLLARIPFLMILVSAYAAAWQRSLARYGAAMIVMGIFIAFNSVVFQHYPTWLMALLPLAAGEWILAPGAVQNPEDGGTV